MPQRKIIVSRIVMVVKLASGQAREFSVRKKENEGEHHRMGQSKSYLRILINRQGGAKFTGC